ncbi:arylsulfatase [Bradyrhizobium sp. JYMT SZCCT0428]|uniref:arylsulfatase n=1 Tax=Bradyrhizobium sp. JYMT SZCCT0428 TaxID=2807673 RepID=UPI001BA71757|nr:arylsulfatase [Bradyrhizobium sp. JYMT SZCCT0428]MBR1156693.1 arylsulfatase [Bradyrhizobium sp. JYMT SZCCT0428]
MNKRIWLGSIASFVALAVSTGSAAAQQPRKPNIVVMLADNLGYGELGVYGGGVLRGAATPRIDALAGEGMRLLNFNVEAQCTPSRSALLTGRFAIRSGTYEVPIGGVPDGLTQWEVTIAELLSAQGYATGIWGKWHLGSAEDRMPTNQGFDEWYGIPRTYDEAMWPSLNETRSMWPSVGNKHGWNANVVHPEHIYEARKGETPQQVAVLDVDRRRTMDAEITTRAVEFIKRNAGAGKPFYAYIPFAQVHMPTLPNPEFAGKTGNGDWADCLAEMDHRTGQILDAIKQASIENDTLVVFASDNGPEATHPWEGDSGPWRGTYFTAMEGSLRAPFIIRWPGQVRAGRVSNEIVHVVDLFTTFARVGGADVPKDRPIDGVDQLDFFLGKQEASNREGFPAYVADRLSAVKWRNWKVHFIWQENMYASPQKLPLPKIINLLTDRKEERDVGAQNSWVADPAVRIISELEISFKKYPPIKVGTPDPYRPSEPGGR